MIKFELDHYRTVKQVDVAIAKIIQKQGGKTATTMFQQLSRVGGSNFRRAMKRLQRIAKGITFRRTELHKRER